MTVKLQIENAERKQNYNLYKMIKAVHHIHDNVQLATGITDIYAEYIYRKIYSK